MLSILYLPSSKSTLKCTNLQKGPKKFRRLIRRLVQLIRGVMRLNKLNNVEVDFLENAKQIS